MFNNLNLPTVLTLANGEQAAIVAENDTSLFGFIGAELHAWDYEGTHFRGFAGMRLIPPFDARKELAKLELHITDALIAFAACGRKITAIKFLRQVQKQAGRPSGLTECKNLYETFVEVNWREIEAWKAK